MKNPEFHPMPGKIVVDLITEEEVNGIIIPSQYQQLRVIGTIRALGDDEEEGDYYDLRVGDTVLFSRNSGVEVTVDRVKVLVLRTSEILCKVTWDDEASGGKAPA
jgi:co-chaperonin GroES (HSP10)